MYYILIIYNLSTLNIALGHNIITYKFNVYNL